MSVFDVDNHVDHTTVKAFLDPSGGPTIQRYDTLKYKQFDQLTDKQLGFFWRPEEVDIYQDAKDFKNLTEHERHIFTSNLKRQILLDSVQGRAPAESFGTIVSLPELENWIITWTFSETIHSRSYTHIIRNIYSNPSKIFDEMMNISEIVDCAGDISKYYDDLIELAGYYNLLGAGTHTVNGNTVVVDLYELKKLLWLALMSVNILEGVRFYVSFACSWAFAELKKMEGNAKIIKLVARDENLHLASTQMLLKLLKKDDPDFEKIATETEAACVKMFIDAVDQEKAWAEYCQGRQHDRSEHTTVE
jgi:Ribonucleotide reductase, beta subunit